VNMGVKQPAGLGDTLYLDHPSVPPNGDRP